ncbi:MAG TPA: glycolate oxidase subunit GlcE [Caulobacteraceae bacterium]|nr:glycolate oxidase subunit GlcE [Caulobacteraceae bacterium]
MSVAAEDDLAEALSEQVRRAAAAGAPLAIIGGGAKSFLGHPSPGEPLELAGHRGVVEYDPSELVITARAGTRLADIEAQLAENGQHLAFEPPVFGPASTIGGVVAAGLSGAARPFAGAVRDFVLGVKVLDGRGQVLRFGGKVFKNVAGFDAFRLMAGAFGCLGALLEVSVRVSPAPRASEGRSLELDWPQASVLVGGLMRRPSPLTGALHDGQRLHLRFAGGPAAVARAAVETGGEPTPAGFWEALRCFRLPILAAPRLWRLSIPREAAVDGLEGEVLRDWGGAQVWLAGEAGTRDIRARAAEVGGHATLFRGARPGERVFSPLPPPLLGLHQRLKAALDPARVFNRGRMYQEL